MSPVVPPRAVTAVLPARRPVGAAVATTPADARLGRKRSSWSVRFLILYTLVEIARPQELFPDLSAWRLGLVAAALTAGAVLVEGKLRTLHGVFSTREVRCLLLILAVGTLTAPLGVWPGGSVAFILDYLKVLVYFAMLLCVVQSEADLRRLVWAFVVSDLLLIGTTYLLWTGTLEAGGIQGRKALEDSLERLSVTESYSANELAVVFVCALPFTLVLGGHSGLLRALFGLSVIAVNGIGLVLTGSRTGFAALAVVGGLTLVRARRVAPAAALLAVVVGAVIMWQVAPAAYWARMAAMVSPTTEYERGYSGRLEVWERGLNLVLARPLYGVGIGAFGTADSVINHQKKERAAHNSYLEIWAELGPVGLVAFLVLLWTAFTRARRVARCYPLSWVGRCAGAVEVTLVGVVVAGFFLSITYSYLLCFVVGASLLCDRVAGTRALPRPGSRS